MKPAVGAAAPNQDTNQIEHCWKYLVVEHHDKHQFAKLLSDASPAGYEPFGGMCVAVEISDGECRFWYMQLIRCKVAKPREVA